MLDDSRSGTNFFSAVRVSRMVVRTSISPHSSARRPPASSPVERSNLLSDIIIPAMADLPLPSLTSTSARVERCSADNDREPTWREMEPRVVSNHDLAASATQPLPLTTLSLFGVKSPIMLDDAAWQSEMADIAESAAPTLDLHKITQVGSFSASSVSISTVYCFGE